MPLAPSNRTAYDNRRSALRRDTRRETLPRIENRSDRTVVVNPMGTAMGSGPPFWRRFKQHHVDFVFACAVIALVVGFFLYEPMRTREFWTGANNGWLQVVPSIGTFVAAVIAAGLAWKNYEAGQQKEISERFQKGVEMLEDGSDTKRSAGVIILEDLALATPGGRHDNWIREHLATVVEHLSQDKRATLPANPASSSHRWISSGSTLARALMALCRLPNRADKPKFLSYLYLVNLRVARVPLTNLVVSLANLTDVEFAECDATGATIRSRAHRDITWSDVNLHNAKLHMTIASNADTEFTHCDLRGARLGLPQNTITRIVRCDVSGLFISGRGKVEFEGCWFHKTPPVRSLVKFEGNTPMGIFHMNEEEISLTPRGFEVRNSTPETRFLSGDELAAIHEVGIFG